MKKIGFALLLAMVLCFAMFMSACGGGDVADPSTEGTVATTEATEPEITEPTVTEPVKIEYVYTIKVVDQDGAPMAGVYVQVCAGETCVPVPTNVDGIAGYQTEVTGNGDPVAKIISMPEGYTYADGIEEISLADGNTDVVFTLVPLSAEATQPEG